MQKEISPPRRPHYPAAMIAGGFLLVLAFFQLQRVALLAFYPSYFLGSAPAELILAAFLHGLRLDAAVAAYAMAVPLLAALLATAWGGDAARNRRAVGGLTLAVFSLMAAVCWGEIGYFGYFLERYSAVAVEYLDSPRLVWGTIWSAYHPLAVLAAAIVSARLFWSLWRRLFPPRGGRIPRAAGLAWLAAASAALPVAMRGGLSQFPIGVASANFSREKAANQLALNGLFSLVTDIRYRWFKDESGKVMDGYFSPEEAMRIAREALSDPGQGRGLRPRPEGLLKVERPRIVLIVLESFSAEGVASLGGPLSLTPEFDRLAGNGVLFTRYFAHTARTAPAIFSLATGLPWPPDLAAMKSPAVRQKFPTVASVLKQAGYQTRFLYGGDIRFENLGGFVRQNGFGEILSVEDFREGREWEARTKWGVPDHLVFDRLHELLLQEGERPSFTLALSLSNHPPYILPPEVPRPYRGGAADEKNAMRYSDWALGRFFEKAREAPYFERTLFIIVGDHAQYYLAEGPNAAASEITRFYVPCLFYGPGVLAAPPGKVEAVAGHMDLAPTILGLLNEPFEHDFWGRDLFGPAPSLPRILASEGRISFLIGDGMVLRDDPLGKPQMFTFRTPWSVAHGGDPPSDDPLLLRGRALTQTVRMLMRPRTRERAGRSTRGPTRASGSSSTSAGRGG